MKTNTLDNSIDFKPTSVEEAGQTRSPAEHAAHIQSLDSKYATPQGETVSKFEESARIEELTSTLNTKPHQTETKKEQIAQTPSNISDSDKAYSELLKEYPDIANANLGKARKIISNSNNQYQFKDVERMTLPLLAVGMGFIASQATLIPSFIAALAAGPTGVVTGVGLAVAGTFGVMPIIAGTGLLGYGGYKLFKGFRENRKLKKNMDKLETAWGNL
jgi:hypothetical protein